MTSLGGGGILEIEPTPNPNLTGPLMYLRPAVAPDPPSPSAELEKIIAS